MVKEIIKTLKKVAPTENSNIIMNLALQFEERTYTAAISEFDYLLRIAGKLIAGETYFLPVRAFPTAPTTPPLSPHRPLICDVDSEEEDDYENGQSNTTSICGEGKSLGF